MEGNPLARCFNPVVVVAAAVIVAVAVDVVVVVVVVVDVEHHKHVCSLMTKHFRMGLTGL